MEQDFIIGRIFTPISAIIYNWVGINISASTLLVLTVVGLAGLGLMIMKKA
jgi:hypothetical protein